MASGPKEPTATVLEVVVDEVADPLRRAERHAAPASAHEVLNATIGFENAVAGGGVIRTRYW